jgi:hypothetical protein
MNGGHTNDDVDGCVAIGRLALGGGSLEDTAAGAVAVGREALEDLTSGVGNVAIGLEAATALTSGSYTTAIGHNACKTYTTKGYATAVGYKALELNNDDYNVAIGYLAGQGAVAGTFEQGVYIGSNAGKGLTTGDGNVLIGMNAGTAMTTGSLNCAVGFEAGKGITTGEGNTAVGHSAMNAAGNTDGDNNTCIGYASGDTIDEGNNNTTIGMLSDVSAATATGQIAIGKGVTCAGDNIATLGIGSNTASLGLDGSDTSWAAASSDERLKENIETSRAGLSFVNDLRPVVYNWKKAKDVQKDLPQYRDSEEPVLGSKYGETLHGFIAQEVKEVIDKHSDIKNGFKMWKEKDDGTQTVADGNLMPIMVRAIQELSAKVEELEAKLK